MVGVWKLHAYIKKITPAENMKKSTDKKGIATLSIEELSKLQGINVSETLHADATHSCAVRMSDDTDGDDMYEPVSDRTSACRRWVRSINDRKMMMPIVYNWCRMQPMPGMTAVDQMTYILCVFAFGDIDVKFRTGTGLSLFGSSPRILDLLFGDTESIQTTLGGSACFKRNHIFRQYKGVIPDTEKFNIQYEYMSEQFMKLLNEVLKRRNVFGIVKLNTINGDHLKQDFVWNDVVHSESANLRAQLIHWYVSLTIFINGANLEALESVTETVCAAMQRVASTMYIFEKKYQVGVHDSVKRYTRKFNDSLASNGSRRRLNQSVRRVTTERYANKVFEIYYDDKSIEDVMSMFSYGHCAPHRAQ